MLAVLLQALLLASSGFFSVGSITLVLLLLLSDRGWRNGLGYALGYFSAYTVIGFVVISLGYRAGSGGQREPGLATPILLIILGLLLLWMGFRNWRKPEPENPQPPRFFAIVDSITPPKAFAFGALVTVMNVKNLALYLSALSVIMLSDLPLAAKLTLVPPVALTFCLLVLAPVLIYLAAPSQAADLLTRFKHALESRSRSIGIWAPLIFGLIFILRGVSILV